MKLQDWLKKEGLTHTDFLVYLKQNNAVVSKGAVDNIYKNKPQLKISGTLGKSQAHNLALT